MGMIRKTLLTAIAAKAVQEARKPENQRKIKAFLDSKRKSGQPTHTA